MSFVHSPDIGAELFDAAYRDVLTPAFPVEELDDEEALRGWYVGDVPDYAGAVAVADGKPVGVALGQYYPGCRVMLLGYLAVGGAIRAQGIGRLIMAEVLPRWEERFRPAAVLAEVENPLHHDANEHGDPVKRLRFYDRLGALLLPLPYFQPSLHPDSGRVRGLFLISFGSRTTIPTTTVTGYLDENIDDCEGTGGRDAEYLALRGLATRWGDDVPLWPMSRYRDVPAGPVDTDRDSRTVQ